MDITIVNGVCEFLNEIGVKCIRSANQPISAKSHAILCTYSPNQDTHYNFTMIIENDVLSLYFPYVASRTNRYENTIAILALADPNMLDRLKITILGAYEQSDNRRIARTDD